MSKVSMPFGLRLRGEFFLLNQGTLAKQRKLKGSQELSLTIKLGRQLCEEEDRDPNTYLVCYGSNLLSSLLWLSTVLLGQQVAHWQFASALTQLALWSLVEELANNTCKQPSRLLLDADHICALVPYNTFHAKKKYIYIYILLEPMDFK